MIIFKKLFHTEIILKIFFITAPFTVSAIFQKISPLIPTSVCVQLIVFIYSIIYLLKKRKICLTKDGIRYLLLFNIPVALSLIGILFASYFENRIEYFQYLKSGFIGRIAMTFINNIILIGLLNITKDWNVNKTIRLIFYYYIGLYIFIIIGIWQLLHFSFGIPFFQLDTRSHIHSVNDSISFIKSRVTSLANEPSYLAPLIIDFMLISFLVSKKTIIPFCLSLTVMIFSYSAGGYLNFFILLCFSAIGFLKYSNFKIKVYYIVLSSFIMLLVMCLVVCSSKEIYTFFYPILGRLSTIFVMQQHSRMFMIVMPFVWVFRGGVINGLVGYGPSSYNYLNLIEKLPNGGNVHVTSNNIFSDTVFELGYLGLVFYFFIFFRFITKSFKYIKVNKYYFLAFILSVHLASSSIYRADFMQARFWILVFIILKLLVYGAGYRDGNSYKECKCLLGYDDIF